MTTYFANQSLRSFDFCAFWNALIYNYKLCLLKGGCSGRQGRSVGQQRLCHTCSCFLWGGSASKGCDDKDSNGGNDDGCCQFLFRVGQLPDVIITTFTSKLSAKSFFRWKCWLTHHRIILKIFNFQIYSDLDIEYFEAALDWVTARDEVCAENGVGLSGVSQVTYIFDKFY